MAPLPLPVIDHLSLVDSLAMLRKLLILQVR